MTAYYILDKLAREGYVEVEREQAGNRPPRRVYRVTSSGQALYFRLLRENLADYSPTHYPTDIGIAFMVQLPPGEVAGHLQQKREQLMAELDALKNASGHSGPLHHVLNRNQRLLKAELEWLDELLEDLDCHARLYGMSKQERQTRIDALKLVELEKAADRVTRGYSGGGEQHNRRRQ